MAGNHLHDHELLDLATGHVSLEEAHSGREHCSQCPQCRRRLESLRPLAERLVRLSAGEDVPAPSAELWPQLFGRAEPLLDEFSRNQGASPANPPAQAEQLAPERRWAAAVSACFLEELSRNESRSASLRPARTRRHFARRAWAVAISILLLVTAGTGAWFLWSDMVPTAAAAIVETSGPVKITPPGQPSRCCRNEGELVRVGTVLSTPEADGAIRLDDATRLALRRGCRLEAQAPLTDRQATFALREGSLCVDTTQARRGCRVETPAGTVRCGKAKTLIWVTSPQECMVATVDGEVEVQCDGHRGVVSPGVCAELKRSEPCCYRPARPKETCCDWVDRCGKPENRRKK